MATRKSSAKVCGRCKGERKDFYFYKHFCDDTCSLKRAFSSNHRECLETLLQHVVHLEIFNKPHHNCLNLVSLNSTRLRVVLLSLVSIGIDINRPGINGCQALNNAVSTHDSNVVELLVRAGTDVNKLTSPGETPLHRAARKTIHQTPEQMKIIFKTLIEAGADVNKLNSSGEAPLHLAIQSGNDICVKALLEAGAEVNITNRAGETPLSLEMKTQYQCKHYRLELLIKAGLDVSDHGSEALVREAMRGYDRVLSLLLKSGADVKPTSYRSLTAATSKCRITCLKLLIDAGADVNALSCSGQTVLFAAVNSTTECVSELLKAGAPVNKLNRYKMNVLQTLIKKHVPERREMEMLLFATGENLDISAEQQTVSARLSLLQYHVPVYLQNENQVQLCLYYLCRRAVRRCLIDEDPHTNLHIRIPKLPLPACVVSYLLYDT